MPLGRKHLRRSRDAPTGGIGHTQRTASRLGGKPSEVNCFDVFPARNVSLEISVSELIPFTKETADVFGRIKGSLKIPPAEAIHLACAATAGTDLFLTNDKISLARGSPESSSSRDWTPTSFSVEPFIGSKIILRPSSAVS